MKRVIKILLYVAPFFFASCNSTSDPATYLKKLRDDKSVNKIVSIGNIQYGFKLIPAEAMALQAAANNGKIDKAIYNSRLADLKGNLFLNIDMQLADHSGAILKYQLKDKSDYEQRIMYYEFYAQKDIKVTCDGKEVPIKSYVYENRQGLSPYNTMVIVFPEAEFHKSVQVSFNDRAFNNLFIKADFKKNDINNLPSLTLN